MVEQQEDVRLGIQFGWQARLKLKFFIHTCSILFIAVSTQRIDPAESWSETS